MAAKRQAEEAEREAQAQRERAQALAEELEALEASRRQKARIDDLLAIADVHLAASRLTTPAGNNALERYREVLALEADNSAALRGMDNIVARYVQLARQSVAKGRFDSARAFVARGQAVLPDSVGLLEATQSIDHEEARFLDRQSQEREEADRKEREERERREREKVENLAEQNDELKRIQEELARLKAEADLKEQLKQQHTAAQTAAVAVPEPEVTVPTLSNPSRLAIFPMTTNRACYRPRALEFRQAVERIIQNERRLNLAYSYYWDDAEHTSVGAPTKLWTGGLTGKTPDFEQVYRVGERMQIDGVVMGWLKCSHSDRVDDSSLPFDVWLVDVERREIFHHQDILLKFERGSRAVIAPYLKSRQ